jgi:hypothetical protein
MKRIIPITLLLLTLILSLSCKREGGRGIFCLKPKGGVVKRSITPETFSSVRMLLPASATLEYAPTCSIEVEGEENILDNINYEIKNGELKVQFDRCVRKLDNPPKMIIRAPYFYGYVLQGSGSLSIPDTLKQVGSTLTLEISGSGEINAVVATGSVISKISGSGSIRVSGTCDTQKMQISGSGDIHGFALASNRAEVDISGSGSANLSVKDYMKVKIAGSGNVNYYGNPSVDLDVSGSGKVNKMD